MFIYNLLVHQFQLIRAAGISHKHQQHLIEQLGYTNQFNTTTPETQH